MDRRIKSVKRFEDLGYEIRVEEHDFGNMEVCYTLDGHYIGEPSRAEFLCKQRGIKPEIAHPQNKVCSIGFSEPEQKWYGWSHRAIFGFGVGHMVSQGDVICKDCGGDYAAGDIARTLEEAKLMAICFADGVG